MTPWTVAIQASLSMRFSRQEYWSGLPYSSLGDLPNIGSEPGSPALQAGSLPFEPQGQSAKWQSAMSPISWKLSAYVILSALNVNWI